MKPSSAARTPANLSGSLHRQLNMYAITASAAGVGVLALARPAEAKIVYTPANVKVMAGSRYAIDLDHNGTADIYLRRSSFYATLYLCASADSRLGNGVAATRSNSHVWAAAMLPGAKIGPARKFAAASRYPNMATGFYSTSERWEGPWANDGKGVKNRYLGIKFKRHGQFHYGWARVTVNIENPKINDINKVVLTGYAYETVPNRPIIAGDTKGPDEVSPKEPNEVLNTPAPGPASLGLLARGSYGLPLWRRKEQAESTA
jgi:hypothetical protein